MSTDERTLDPGAPLFFVSYARSQENRRPGQRSVHDFPVKFFEDLSADITELLGREAGADPGFIDKSLRGGERWTPQLLNAVGTCQVFIPLISKPLTRSKWCCMEWDAFSRREVVRVDGQPAANATGILPVIWTHTERHTLPAMIRDVQFFSPGGTLSLAAIQQYEREGIYGLLRMNKDKAYRAVVWKLAQRVAEDTQKYWVRPDVPTSTKDLRTAFQEEEEK